MASPARPSVIIRENTMMKNSISDPNCTIYVGMFNLVKKIIINFNNKRGVERFESDTVYTVTIG